MFLARCDSSPGGALSQSIAGFCRRYGRRKIARCHRRYGSLIATLGLLVATLDDTPRLCLEDLNGGDVTVAVAGGVTKDRAGLDDTVPLVPTLRSVSLCRCYWRRLYPRGCAWRTLCRRYGRSCGKVSPKIWIDASCLFECDAWIARLPTLRSVFSCVACLGCLRRLLIPRGFTWRLDACVSTDRRYGRCLKWWCHPIARVVADSVSPDSSCSCRFNLLIGSVAPFRRSERRCSFLCCSLCADTSAALTVPVVSTSLK